MTSVPFAVALVAKVTALLLLGHVASLVFRHVGPTARHAVWVLTLAAALALPLAVAGTPAWRVPILPARAAGPTAAPVASRPVAPVATRADIVESVGTATPASGRRAGPSWFALAWAAGLAAVLAWIAVGRLMLRRLERTARPLDAPAWRALLIEESRRLAVARPVRLLACPLVGGPVTWGWRRPAIVLPDACDGWTDGVRRVALQHELAHVARGDSATQLMASLACALYWFHPLAWVAARRLATERERACDERVLTAGTPAAEYAAHLLQVARFAKRLGAPGLVAATMARPSQLEGRLLAVLHWSRPARRFSPAARAVAAGSALALLLAVSAFRPAPRAAGPAAAGFQADSVIERTLDAAPGGTLALSLETGATVTITGWDERRISLRARLSGPDWRETALTLEPAGDGALLTTRYTGDGSIQSFDHTLDVRVPRRFNVRIASAGGGVALRDLDGEFSGHTGGGPITIERASGHARLRTGGGEIRVDDVDLSGSVSTGGGGVTLTRVRGGLRGTSGSGPVTHDGQRLHPDELSGLEHLDHLDEVDHLDHVDGLDQLHELDHLRGLDRLDALGELGEFGRFGDFGQFGELGQFGDVVDLDRLAELEALADLDRLTGLEQLAELDRLRELTRLGALGELRELRGLSELRQLGSLAELGQLGRLGERLSALRRLGDGFDSDGVFNLRGDQARLRFQNVSRHITKAGGSITLETAPGGVYLSTGGGAIRVGPSDGDVHASTGGGDITLGPVEGSVVATTGAGDVSIAIRGAGAHSVEVFSGNGRVILELPAGLSAAFDLETAYTRGFGRATRIESDFELETSETVTWDAREGTPRRYVRASGTAGAGDGLIRVRVVNGDVVIRRR